MGKASRFPKEKEEGSPITGICQTGLQGKGRSALFPVSDRQDSDFIYSAAKSVSNSRLQ